MMVDRRKASLDVWRKQKLSTSCLSVLELVMDVLIAAATRGAIIAGLAHRPSSNKKATRRDFGEIFFCSRTVKGLACLLGNFADVTVSAFFSIQTETLQDFIARLWHAR